MEMLPVFFFLTPGKMYSRFKAEFSGHFSYEYSYLRSPGIILKSDLFEDTGYKIRSASYHDGLQYHFVITFQIFFIFFI